MATVLHSGRTALFSQSSAGFVCRQATRQSSLRRLTWQRGLQSPANQARDVPDFAFAFDIDGVLVRHHDPIPKAAETLRRLQADRIPFILLTNGGGKSEEDRVAELSDKLDVPLDVSMFVQSHTPFAALADEYKGKTVLVAGGDEDKCRKVAEKYGFTSVVTPGDIMTAHPEIWPFSQQLVSHYEPFSRPLPVSINSTDAAASLKIDAIFVYNDPRDWGLDATIIIDLLLSEAGRMGTLSHKNGNIDLPNKGYQQDNQPKLFYSNPDLWWAAKYHLPRMGQGGFREALEGIWAAVTGGAGSGVELKKTIIGKPYHPTYEFAENRLLEHRKTLFEGLADVKPLKRVYMVGDNPESDIRGGNEFKSPHGVKWSSLLVRTGVYQEGQEPSYVPTAKVDDVHDAVDWALRQSKWI